MNLESELLYFNLVTFILRFVTQSKLSLIFNRILSFPHKTTFFSNNSHNVYKGADGKSKCNRTKSSPWKLTFWKQPIIAKDEIKVNVILASKSEEFPYVFLR